MHGVPRFGLTSCSHQLFGTWERVDPPPAAAGVRRKREVSGQKTSCVWCQKTTCSSAAGDGHANNCLWRDRGVVTAGSYFVESAYCVPAKSARIMNLSNNSHLTMPPHGTKLKGKAQALARARREAGGGAVNKSTKHLHDLENF